MSGINVIREPSVYLVGRQQVADDGLHQFLHDHGVEDWGSDGVKASQVLTEVAGRLCYMSFANPRPGGNKAYLGHIKEVGHGSVLEHAVWNFIITGVSRSFTHELVRHRVGFSYSQLSQRFVDETKGGVLDVVVPPALLGAVEAAQRYVGAKGGGLAMATFHIGTDLEDEPAERAEVLAGLEWLRLIEHARGAYDNLVAHLERTVEIPEGNIDHTKTARRKAAREAARSVLPNATETKIFVTGNCRAVRHFLELRGDASADAEIRRVALAMLGVVQKEAPNLFDDYAVSDGAITTPYPKV